MQSSSTALTIGLALDHAQMHGSRIDVTTSNRVFATVTVAALDRFCIVLVDVDAPGAQAHVVSRESIIGVSMDRSELLSLEQPSHSRPGQAEPPLSDATFVFGP
jgi:hypothetical protein